MNGLQMQKKRDYINRLKTTLPFPNLKRAASLKYNTDVTSLGSNEALFSSLAMNLCSVWCPILQYLGNASPFHVDNY